MIMKLGDIYRKIEKAFYFPRRIPTHEEILSELETVNPRVAARILQGKQKVLDILEGKCDGVY